MSSSWLMLIHSRLPDPVGGFILPGPERYTSKPTLAAAYGALTNGFQMCAGSLFQTKGDFTMEFFNSAVDVLKTLVVALGAGLGVWGAVNLMEGYGNDNPGSNAHVR